MIIAIASGKGGTGKTTIATNLALSLAANGIEKIQFLDCDVEEPNAAIFLKPRITRTQPVSIPVPKIDYGKCTFCGRCAEICAYNAIAVIHPAKHSPKGQVLVFPELCHGCGGCSLLCPEKAISEVNREIGILEEGKAGSINFIQGRLNIGEPAATPLIRAVKSYALFNDSTDNQLTIIDVPPGTSCPVIEAVRGSDFVVLVTEPTPFGLNDLVLTVETVRELDIPAGGVINRDGIGDEGVAQYCQKEEIPILMRIPMDRKIAEAYSRGDPLIKTQPGYLPKFLDPFKELVKLTETGQELCRKFPP